MNMLREETGMPAISTGVYSITNKLNGKRYIGQSKNIPSRITVHKYLLSKTKKSKDCNRHLYKAVVEDGIDNFSFEIIELCSKEDLLDREAYWINYYKTTDREYGYNLRVDTKEKSFVHEETVYLLKESMLGSNNPNYGNKWSYEQKQRMSDIKKRQYSDGTAVHTPEHTYKGLTNRNKKWEKNPSLKKIMGQRVSNSIRKYDIAQLDYNTLDVIEVYKGRLDLKERLPGYYTQAILGCCSGTKNSYKGFKWKYVERELDEEEQSNNSRK